MDGIRWRNGISCRAARTARCVGGLRRKSKGVWPALFAAVAVLLASGAAGAAQEIAQTMPADDLPDEFRILLGTDSGHDCRWTLIGKNDKAQEQERLHPELNAVRAIWHFPLARDRGVFKFEFTRPIRKGGNVFHVYVKADGDEKTGRRHEGVHNGVDYMFTVIDGEPDHASTRLDVFESDGFFGVCIEFTAMEDFQNVRASVEVRTKTQGLLSRIAPTRRQLGKVLSGQRVRMVFEMKSLPFESQNQDYVATAQVYEKKPDGAHNLLKESCRFVVDNGGKDVKKHPVVCQGAWNVDLDPS